MITKTYILYHANCMDGLGSKFAAWMKYGADAEYIPVQYGKPVPEMDHRMKFKDMPLDGIFKVHDNRPVRKITENVVYCEEDDDMFKIEPDRTFPVPTEIYLVDFAYPLDVLTDLQSRFHKVMVLDHHKTAKEALSSFKSSVFDMNKSGAVLTWEYFHPNTPVPDLLLHIQDRDLWKFDIEGTKRVHAGLGLLGDDMPEWKRLSTDSDKGRHLMNSLKSQGRTILQYEKSQLLRQLMNVKIVPFLGLKLGVINSGYLVSETGAEICNTMEVDAALMWTYSGKDVIMSFRSQAGSNIDVSAIAKNHFAGGGHPNASGGRCSISIIEHILKGGFK